MIIRFFKLEDSFSKEIQALFPSLTGVSFRFKIGLPWFILRKFARAIAIPALFSYNESYIYVTKEVLQKPDFHRIMIHEMTHIFQYQTLGNRGFGLLRSGFVLYVYYFLKHGYCKHPMEVTARQIEEQWMLYQNKGEISLIHKALEKEGERLILEKKRIFQWRNPVFVLALILTMFLTMILSIISLPGSLIFLICQICVFKQRGNG